MFEISRWALLVYGVLLIVGGVLGYVLPEKPSKVSLIAGGLTGLAAIAAFVLVPRQPTVAFSMGIAVALVNEAAMAVRLKKTRKFMPAGMLVLVSGLVFLVCLLALLSAR